MAAVSGITACHATLTASTVDTVTLTDTTMTGLELVHHGNVIAPIYFRVDGVDPVVAADECEVLLPGERLPIGARRGVGQSVRLISAGAATYSLVAVQ